MNPDLPPPYNPSLELWQRISSPTIPGEEDLETADLAARYDQLKQSQVTPGFKLALLLLSMFPLSLVGHQIDPGLSFFPFLLVVPALYYYRITRNFLNEVLKLSIAQQLHWHFSPRMDDLKWSDLQIHFPDMFLKGNANQYISDQFWGTLSAVGISYPFWLGEFTYAEAYTDGRGYQHQTIHHETIFAFLLPRPVSANFSLSARGLLARMAGEANLTTESTEFNQAYTIGFQGNRAKVGPAIFQVLTPPVLEGFVEFHRSFQPEQIIFEQQIMIMSFKGDRIGKRSNWGLNTAIAPELIQEIQTWLERCVALSVPIVSQVE